MQLCGLKLATILTTGLGLKRGEKVKDHKTGLLMREHHSESFKFSLSETLKPILCDMVADVAISRNLYKIRSLWNPLGRKLSHKTAMNYE